MNNKSEISATPPGARTVELFRTPKGYTKIEFVDTLHGGRRVQQTVDFENVKSTVELEAWVSIWTLTGKVPLGAMEVRSR